MRELTSTSDIYTRIHPTLLPALEGGGRMQRKAFVFFSFSLIPTACEWIQEEKQLNVMALIVPNAVSVEKRY